MTKKKIDLTALQKDLQATELTRTGFFTANKKPNIVHDTGRTGERIAERSTERTTERITEQTNERTKPKRYKKRRTLIQNLKNQKRRETKRFSFEIYKDQEILLDEIQLLAKRKFGVRVPLSAIIRDALDQYLPLILKDLKDAEDK